MISCDPFRWCAAAALAVVLTGCAAAPRFAAREGAGAPRKETPRTEPARKPAPATGRVLLTLEGIVSYYANDFHGKLTSNGETFDMHSLTAAHRTFPFGTSVRVTNLENGKTVLVRVNDRGPFVDGRIMDLSLGAAKEIDLIKNGTTKARLEVMEWGDGK